MMNTGIIIVVKPNVCMELIIYTYGHCKISYVLKYAYSYANSIARFVCLLSEVDVHLLISDAHAQSWTISAWYPPTYIRSSTRDIFRYSETCV